MCIPIETRVFCLALLRFSITERKFPFGSVSWPRLSRRRDSRDRSWRRGDLEAYGDQSYYSREEDIDSISSQDRYLTFDILSR